MKKVYCLIIIVSCITVFSVSAQQLRNAAVLNVPSGTTLRITGDLINESTGSIELEGVIELKGNWINHKEGLDLGGQVRFVKNPGQQISGSHVTIFGDVTIIPNSILTLPQGMATTITGQFNNQNGTNGFVMEPGASLIHVTSEVPGTVKQITDGEAYSWHMLSSPVAAQPISPEFSDGSFYAWNEPYQAWVAFGSTYYPTWSMVNSGHNNFIPGKGYMTAFPYVNGQPQTKTFVGNLNAGNYTFTLDRKAFTTDNYLGFNQLGNPYPSSIDWKASTGWTGRQYLQEDGGGYNIWIWNGSAQGGGNYGAYNSASSSDEGTLGVGRYIAPMQAFWVRAGANGDGQTIGMSNAIRVHSNQQWLKKRNPEPGIIRLAISNNVNGYCDELSIEFGHNQDNGGAQKMFSHYATAPNLYSIKDNCKWTINFLTDIQQHPIVPLGFKAGVDATYSITAVGAEYFTDVVLEDLLTGVKQNLNSNPVYLFNAKTTDKSERFLLRFMAVGIDQPIVQSPGIYYANQQLHVFIPWPGLSTVQALDASGRLIRSFNLLGQGVHHLEFRTQPGLYVIRLFNENRLHTSKIIVGN